MQLSFRTRLRLFFVIVVLLPGVVTGAALLVLVKDNEDGKSDADLAARTRAPIRLAEQARADGGRAAASIGRDIILTQALRDGDATAATRRATQLLGREGARRIVVLRGGRRLADVGSPQGVFPAVRRLVDRDGLEIGRLAVAVQEARLFVETAGQVSGLDVVLTRDDEVLASTLPATRLAGAEQIPVGAGDTRVGGRDFRTVGLAQPDVLGAHVQVSALYPETRTSGSVRQRWLVIGVVLAGYFAIATFLAVALLGFLGQTIGSFLSAARRLASGDFSERVPTVGEDGFAALGHEFNRMSDELEARMDELEHERARLKTAMHRVAEMSAANLDRDAVLQIVLGTALDGTGATGGRAVVREHRSAPLVPVAQSGPLEHLEAALLAAESAVLETGMPQQASVGEIHALAHPLRASVKEDPDDAGPPRLVGIVAIARADAPFSPADRELFDLLAASAGVSVENVGLHQTVERQAATDELTGLSNRRRFESTLATEVERSRRFGDPVGLVMLDIDDFKAVNDLHGHQAGDVVLQEVARVLRESSREIDEPARYGGEELVVILPGTDLDGAYNLAERVRRRIAALRLPVLGPDGGPLQVTASFGAATVPDPATTPSDLVQAADAALYAAKRAGKNRTVRAGTG